MIIKNNNKTKNNPAGKKRKKKYIYNIFLKLFSISYRFGKITRFAVFIVGHHIFMISKVCLLLYCKNQTP